MGYQKYADKTLLKLSQKGGTCTLTRKGDTEVYDPTTNTYSSTDVTINGKALMSNYSESAVNGTIVLAGDVKFMAVFDEPPKNTDIINFGGISYTIVRITPFNPDGNCVIYYTIQAR